MNGWTSNNKRIDEFIRKSQQQTKSANEAYLEWIPFDWFSTGNEDLFGLPTREIVKLIPLEMDELYNDKVR